MNTPSGLGSLNPYVSVDCVIFGFERSKLHVLLIQRQLSDHDSENKGVQYALPGDLIYDNEGLDMAAMRVLKELTGLKNIFLEQFNSFGDPDRLSSEEDKKWLNKVRAHPNARVITIAYFSLVNMNDYVPKAASFASSAQWIPIDTVGKLPFDHNQILEKALHRLNQSLKSRPVGFNLLPQKFTLAQLQQLYEVILNKNLDKRNFRRKILKIGMLKKLDEKQSGVAHKPASYYSFDPTKYQDLVERGFDDFGF
ncbi:MAG: NUDIX hydrolase [Bacteroidetes bacterium]|nr:NUDIX hydrolase [Bacteroidota bacterium]